MEVSMGKEDNVDVEVNVDEEKMPNWQLWEQKNNYGPM